MKVLIVRFSSIGDIVLTTPVIRCLKTQLKDVEIHYLVKDKFIDTVQHNPYLEKTWTIKLSTDEILKDLKNENFDLVIDLHNNIRTKKLKLQLRVPSVSFNKLNLQKWIKTIFKKFKLPNVHIVDRYLETVSYLGIKNDQKGLDYFFSEKDRVDPSKINTMLENKFTAIVIGGSYFTKQIPLDKLIEICSLLKQPVVLLGGNTETEIGKIIENKFTNVINLCGLLRLNQSASIIEQSDWIITSDTGLMHIAAAYKKKIISIWGNTIPEFGMSPYLPGIGSKIVQVENLSCRPCSKLGYRKCPKKHFNCMNTIDVREILS